MELLFEGYCKVLKGEEKEDVYLSLFPEEMREAKKTVFQKTDSQGRFDYEECSYRINSTYTDDQTETIEKFANEDNDMSLDLKECKNASMNDGTGYGSDKRVCLTSDGKWYLIQE